MEIIGTLQEFSDREYAEAAYLLRIPMRRLQQLNIYPVSPREARTLGESYTGIDTEYLYEMTFYPVDNKIFYFINTAISTDVEALRQLNTFILGASYLISSGRIYIVNIFTSNFHCYAGILDEIRRMRSNRDHYQNRMNELEQKISVFDLPDFNFKEISKIARKFKCKSSNEGSDLILKFNKVKCGNETEGYVAYKSITLYFKLGFMLQPYRYKMEFQNFIYDSSHPISGVRSLHPHLNDESHICYGNRDGDMVLYTRILNFPFIFEVWHTSLNSYDSENPYTNIKTILQKLKVLNIVYKDCEKMNPSSTPQQLMEHMASSLDNCPQCHNIIATSTNICTNLTCTRCADASIYCGDCGSLTERGEWSETRNRYHWYCRNENCGSFVPASASTSVPTSDALTIEPVTEASSASSNGSTATAIAVPSPLPHCVICDRELEQADSSHLACRDNHHGHDGVHNRVRFLWQYMRHGDRWELIIFEHCQTTFIPAVLNAQSMLLDADKLLNYHNHHGIICPICDSRLEEVEMEDYDDGYVYCCATHEEIYTSTGQRI